MGKNLSRNCLAIILFTLLGSGMTSLFPRPASAQFNSPQSFPLTQIFPRFSLTPNGDRPRLKHQDQPPTALTCPQDLETLVNQLLQDLPGYGNRLNQVKRQQPGQSPIQPDFIVLASQADFRPLLLNQWQYRPQFPDTSRQVFFTTLERTYQPTKIDSSQNFYWAFFVPTNQGWQLALLLAQFGSPQTQTPLLPLQDVTQGAIGQSIQQWLRDCQSGGIPAFRSKTNSSPGENVPKDR
jgi:hypothetical protein